jgi:hypothetical protein
MRRCYKSSPRTTSRMSSSLSAWQISALGLQRVVPSTPHLPRRQGRIASPTPRTVATTTTTETIRRRKLAATTNHRLAPPLSQLQRLVEAEAHEATSAPIKCPVATTAAHDTRYITPHATVRVSTRRSRSSQNSFARSSSNRT